MTTTNENQEPRREEPAAGANGAPSASNGNGAAKEIKVPPEWAKEREEAVNNSSVTNSQDNKLLRARIFVGNLPADLRTERGELFDKFRKHGHILGVSIHSRFAFVQFEREEDAKTAVKEEHRSELRSARLDIKMAMEGRVNNRERDRDRDRDRERDRRPRTRSRSPIDRRRSRSRSPRRSRDRGNIRHSVDRYRDMSRDRSPPPYVPIPVEERFCHPRTYGPNDVEMVIIRKQQGQYADSILRRLYDRRIAANMLFLAEHASLEGAITEFGRTGSHYVIIIMPKHEETRAVTVNIFETNEKPREYRNINVEEGVSLIHRHFRDHYPALARLREMEYQGAGFYPTGPSEVMRCLARMVETCAVPTSSLDQTIRYLQDMRDRTAIAEGISITAAATASAPLVVPQQSSAVAYRVPSAADNNLGKLMGQLDSRMPAEETVRESLLGLLKATGLMGNLAGGAVPAAAAPQSQHSAYGGAASAGADYYTQPSGYGTSSIPSNAPYTQSPAPSGSASQQYGQTAGASQYASSTPTSQFPSGTSSQYASGQGERGSDATLHKAYDSLVSSGVLRPGQPMGAHTPPSQGPGAQAPREDRERQPQQPTAYRTAVKEENGMDYGGMHSGGGGVRYDQMGQQSAGQYQTGMQQGRNVTAAGGGTGQERVGQGQTSGGANAAGQPGGYSTTAGGYIQRQQPAGQQQIGSQAQYNTTGRR